MVNLCHRRIDSCSGVPLICMALQNESQSPSTWIHVLGEISKCATKLYILVRANCLLLIGNLGSMNPSLVYGCRCSELDLAFDPTSPPLIWQITTMLGFLGGPWLSVELPSCPQTWNPPEGPFKRNMVFQDDSTLANRRAITLPPVMMEPDVPGVLEDHIHPFSP